MAAGFKALTKDSLNLAFSMLAFPLRPLLRSVLMLSPKQDPGPEQEVWKRRIWAVESERSGPESILSIASHRTHVSEPGPSPIAASPHLEAQDKAGFLGTLTND